MIVIHPLYRTRPAMLDGKRYYGAFPDEKPILSSLHAFLRTLEKLEGEFRRYVEQSGEGDTPEKGLDGPSQDQRGYKPGRVHNEGPAISGSGAAVLTTSRSSFQWLTPVSFKSSRIP
jgi:hypothetical protein